MAKLYQIKGEEADAIRFYEQAIALDRKAATAWSNYGLLLQKRDRPKAERALRTAYELRSNRLEPGVNLVVFLLESEKSSDWAVAERIAKTEVARFPQSSHVAHILGLAQIKLGKLDEGLNSFRRVTGLDADQHDAAIGVAATLLARERLRKPELQAAETVLRRVIAADPEKSDAYYWLAQAAYERNDVKQYVTLLRTTLKHNKDDVGALMDLADVYADSGMLWPAKRLYYRAHLADPEDVDVRSRLADTAVGTEDSERVVRQGTEHAQRIEISISCASRRGRRRHRRAGV